MHQRIYNDWSYLVVQRFSSNYSFLLIIINEALSYIAVILTK